MIPYPSVSQANEWLHISENFLTSLVGVERMPSEDSIVYGRGGWGVVYATQTPGLALKLTLDSREHVFVKAAHALGEWPLGVLKHYASVDTRCRYNDNKVFAIWRDVAEVVDRPTNWPDVNLTQADQLETDLDLYCEYAYRILHLIKQGVNACRTPFSPDDDIMRPLDAAVGTPWITNYLSRFKPQKQFCICIAKIKDILENSENDNPLGRTIVQALRWYLDRGIVLADPHLNNLGLMADGTEVIIDCGTIGLLKNAPDLHDQTGQWVDFK